VRTLARDPGKARDRLGPDSRLEIITGDLGTPADLEAAFRGAHAAYVALGSIGLEGNLGRVARRTRRMICQRAATGTARDGPDAAGLAEPPNKKGDAPDEYAVDIARNHNCPEPSRQRCSCRLSRYGLCGARSGRDAQVAGTSDSG